MLYPISSLPPYFFLLTHMGYGLFLAPRAPHQPNPQINSTRKHNGAIMCPNSFNVTTWPKV